MDAFHSQRLGKIDRIDACMGMRRANDRGMQGAGRDRRIVGVSTQAAQKGGVFDTRLPGTDMAGAGFGVRQVTVIPPSNRCCY